VPHGSQIHAAFRKCGELREVSRNARQLSPFARWCDSRDGGHSLAPAERVSNLFLRWGGKSPGPVALRGRASFPFPGGQAGRGSFSVTRMRGRTSPRSISAHAAMTASRASGYGSRASASFSRRASHSGDVARFDSRSASRSPTRARVSTTSASVLSAAIAPRRSPPSSARARSR